MTVQRKTLRDRLRIAGVIIAAILIVLTVWREAGSGAFGSAVIYGLLLVAIIAGYLRVARQGSPPDGGDTTS